MLRFRLKELVVEREFREKRRITLDEVARETGISRNTLSRIANTFGYNTTTDNLDLLCEYFGCPIEKLVEHVPDQD